MDSERPSASLAAEALCGGERPILVDIELFAESSPFVAAVNESGCRLFRESQGSDRHFVVSGFATDLTRLRGLLVRHPALRLAREKIEETLGRIAAPGGLPWLREKDQKLTDVAPETKVPKGTTLRVSRDFSFDAAHNLPRYNGKCERLHGHTFKVRVTVEAPLDPWSGMSFDFHDLKAAVNKRVVDILDHAYINETVPNPSAEMISIWIWNQLADLPLSEISVWETPSCFVTYHGPRADAE